MYNDTHLLLPSFTVIFLNDRNVDVTIGNRTADYEPLRFSRSCIVQPINHSR